VAQNVIKDKKSVSKRAAHSTKLVPLLKGPGSGINKACGEEGRVLPGIRSNREGISGV